MNPEERLKQLGIELPKPRSPVGSYVPSVRSGKLLFVSGLGPDPTDGKPWSGKVGADYTIEEGARAARAVGLAVLARVRNEIGSLDNVARLVKVLGFVSSAPGFGRQPAVMNGFSDLMVEVFGDAGRHARSAIGVNELPNNIPVEVETVFELK